MSTTEKHRLNRASSKLGAPVEQLNQQVVNLVFGTDQVETVYKIVESFLNLQQELDESGLTFKDVSNMIKSNNQLKES